MKGSSQRIVITGASSGIGAATAIAFARQGCHLVLGARGRDGLDDVARRCREAGGRAEVGVVDATDADQVRAFAAEARQALGGIDLWFSDVGIGVVGKYVDVPIADHQRVIASNLVSHMNDAHAVVPIFVEQGYGTWVNMISAGGFVTTPYAAAYSASKFGLRGFSEALRAELNEYPDIHVCDVYPTFVDTPGIHHAGNYTGARLAYPPGVLAPETVADAIVRLARRPRDTTAIGVPATLLKLSQFANPVTTALMNRFMNAWSKKADRVPETTGTIYTPPAGASGIHGGQRRMPRGGNTALVIGAAVAAAAIGIHLSRRDS
ncbi:SDR family oxidoreductase [Pseudoduganella plicata]|uniref:SDR family oxidoreductase n=1 Tax=Pseudoduganella plicata TaxID=321984 RepID=A0A4V1ATF4_9BURK|nr:SDR family oxidoreductase [Pseudoduganella plicata]QBQ35478.1 SDR family oxidoreductase [Pseudoduganella plicata]GGZ02088.1 short-chain dehydrogenase [Pseudoduganella plicata]